MLHIDNPFSHRGKLISCLNEDFDNPGQGGNGILTEIMIVHQNGEIAPFIFFHLGGNIIEQRFNRNAAAGIFQRDVPIKIIVAARNDGADQLRHHHGGGDSLA